MKRSMYHGGVRRPERFLRSGEILTVKNLVVGPEYRANVRAWHERVAVDPLFRFMNMGIVKHRQMLVVCPEGKIIRTPEGVLVIEPQHILGVANCSLPVMPGDLVLDHVGEHEVTEDEYREGWYSSSQYQSVHNGLVDVPVFLCPVQKYVPGNAECLSYSEWDPAATRVEPFPSMEG